MTKRKLSQSPITALLNDDRVRRAHHADQTYYSIIDLIQILTETRFPNECWEDLKKREPALAAIEARLEIDHEGQTDVIAAVDVSGVFRLIQSISSPQAEKLKRWLAESAAQ